jgi:predicted esterase
MSRVRAALTGIVASCLLLAGRSHAADSATVARVATSAELFGAADATALSHTLPPERRVSFRVRVPPGDRAHGVLVFVKPVESGELPAGWAEVLDERDLLWIAADGFGNDVPTAQRVLAALMAVELAKRSARVDPARIYVSGMSGGGRVASQVAVRFPRRFTGALYIVGADFWSRSERPLLPFIQANRYVFLTGERDFNRREMRRVHTQYVDAGATRALLIDLPGFGHEYPAPADLARALEFLDEH